MNDSTQTRRDFIRGIGMASVAGMTGALSSCATDFGTLGMGPGLMPTLLIRPDDLVRRFSPNFPVQRDYRGLLNMQFSDPVFGMVPDRNKVRLGLTTLGSVGKLMSAAGLYTRQLGGRCQLACGLRFDPETRAIYLKDTELEQFSLAGVPSQWTSDLRGIVNLLGSSFLEKRPIYKLGDGLGTRYVKDISVQNNGLLLSFGI